MIFKGTLTISSVFVFLLYSFEFLADSEENGNCREVDEGKWFLELDA
jgi:hypothetical protein